MKKIFILLMVVAVAMTSCENDDALQNSAPVTETQEYDKNTSNDEQGDNSVMNNEEAKDDTEDVGDLPLSDREPIIACVLTVAGRITDTKGNPVTTRSLIIMINKRGMAHFTNENGEYEVSFGYETSPWEYGTPTLTITYEESGYPQVGYIPQTITYEFSKEHRVEDTELDEEYLIDDADVVLQRR